MGVKTRQFLTSSLSVASVIVIGLPIYAMQRMGIETLLACSSGTGGINIPSSACEIYLNTFRGTPDDISELSQGAGLAFVLADKNDDKRFRHADFLIAKGLSVDGPQNYTTGKLTPLHCEVLSEDASGVRYLLSKGANLEIRESKNKQTPLEFAEQLAKTNESPQLTEIINLLRAKQSSSDKAQ